MALIRSGYVTNIQTMSLLVMIVCLAVIQILGDEGCPWSTDLRVSIQLRTKCQCARTPLPSSHFSIQCNDIDGPSLVTLLLSQDTFETLELLYLNSSRVTDSVGQVPPRIFRDVKIVSLQLSGCGIKSLHPDALNGQSNSLKHLSLTMNLINEIPQLTLEKLNNLSLLDLSHNRLETVGDAAFAFLHKLTTLKLNDNQLQLSRRAFYGIEHSLKNLNLKGTRLSTIPEAIQNLSTLAFLDLAQNRIRELEGTPFQDLHALTALNLERNLLQTLPSTVFMGVNDSLSSLSLLNNLITHFPREALQTLRELKVLDLGFNLLTEIPENAFMGLNEITLLALDGNPLASLPIGSFRHLNTNLRGLSLGGKFLNCDCRLQWISNWIIKHDLQVTSRERNPQFCGNPPQLRLSNFYELKYDDLQCDSNSTVTSSISTVTTTMGKLSTANQAPSRGIEKNEPQVHSNVSTNGGLVELSRTRSELGNSQSDLDPIEKAESIQSTLRPFVKRVTKSSNVSPKSVITSTTTSTSTIITYANTQGKLPTTSATTTSTTMSPKNFPSTSSSSPTFFDEVSKISVITGIGSKIAVPSVPPAPTPTSNIGNIVQVRVTHAPTTPSTISRKTFRNPNTQAPLVLLTSSLADGAKIPSRLSTSIQRHQQIPPIITTSEKSHQPSLSEDDIQIEEVTRSGDSILVNWSSSKLNGFRIIYRHFGEDTFRHGPPLAPSETEYRIQNIPSNECIVVCVVPYEEIVYNEISTSASSIPPGSQCRELKPFSSSSLMNNMDKVTVGASAAICFTVLVAVSILILITRRKRKKGHDSSVSMIAKLPSSSYAAPSPGPLPPGSITPIKDWDQLSAVSSKSIPRPRIYGGTIDGPSIGTGPSRGVIPAPHSHHHHHHYATNRPHQQRPIPDGHSTHGSYLSGSHNHGHQLNMGLNTYLNNQSRLLRASFGTKQTLNRQESFRNGHHHSKHDQHHQRRKGQRHSASDSMNTMSGYDTTTDNWTDHDMDVYVAQNPTRRDLVQI